MSDTVAAVLPLAWRIDQPVSLRETFEGVAAGRWGRVTHGTAADEDEASDAIVVEFPAAGGGLDVLRLRRETAERILEPAWTRDGNESLSKIAQTALDIQHAVNGSGLAHGLSEVFAELHRCCPGRSTEFYNQHPIVRLWISQLARLAGLGDYVDTYIQVKAIAEGRAG